MNNSKSGFHIIISIFLIAIFTTIFLIFLPKTSKTIANKVKQIDSKIAQENVVDNYKAEYAKLIDKKKDIQNMIIKFRTRIKIESDKYNVEEKMLTEYKKVLTRYQLENDSVHFKATLIQYNSQKLKLETIARIKEGVTNGIKNLEKAIAKIDVAISEMRSNIDTVEYKKLLVDSYKEINSMLESIKGVDENPESTFSIEKLNEDFIREGVKLDVLSDEAYNISTNDVQVMSQDQMKKIIDSL